MFIAKTVKASTDMMIQLRTRTVKKEYVALVAGRFPEQVQPSIHTPLFTLKINTSSIFFALESAANVILSN